MFYLIENKNCTYAGVSNDPVKRLRKHNGEISGGARYTRSKGCGWKHVCIVEGFPDKIASMQFEWAVKHEKPIQASGIVKRVAKMVSVMNKDKWTSNSLPSINYPLNIVWYGSNKEEACEPLNNVPMSTSITYNMILI